MADLSYSLKVSPVPGAVIGEAGIAALVTINEAENALFWLFRRKRPDGTPWLSAEQFAAGEKLREDYTLGLLGARVTASWNEAIASGSRSRSGPPKSNASDRVIAAKARYANAIDAVGPELSGILVSVCCLASGLEAAEGFNSSQSLHIRASGRGDNGANRIRALLPSPRPAPGSTATLRGTQRRARSFLCSRMPINAVTVWD